jgi:RHS repeat-associated protein
MNYQYAVNGTGLKVTASYALGPNEATETQYDQAGRMKQESKGGFATNYLYNNFNQLEYIEDADSVKTLYAYNSKGEHTTTARQFYSDDSIDYGSDDVTFTETAPAYRGSTPVLETVTKVWKTGADQANGTIVSTVQRTPDGLNSWASNIGVTGATSRVTSVTAPGHWTETTTRPDGAYSIIVYDAGRWDSTTEYDSNNQIVSGTSARTATNTLGYDSLKRLTHVKDRRTGVTVTAYRSTVSDAVQSVTPPAGTTQTTSYTYDHRGLRLTVDAPNSLAFNNATLTNVTTTNYYPSGMVAGVTGGQTYPVEYTYDYANRIKTMVTHGAVNNGTTTWNYQPTTGRLASKLDHNGKGPAYTYHPSGRVYTKTWQRTIDPLDVNSDKATATYEYLGGRPYWIYYNDNTPGIFCDYLFDTSDANHAHSPGMLSKVWRGSTETVFKFDLNLRPVSELQPFSDTGWSRVLTRTYDNLGRSTGFKVGTDSDDDLDYTVARTFDAAGRTDQITGGGKTFTYGYETNSNGLVKTVTGSVVKTTNTYETTRDVLDFKLNEAVSPVVLRSKFDYTVNAFGQRTAVATDGSAFTGVNRGWSWGYDSKGQVAKGTHAADGTLTRQYTFDGIGNRTDSKIGTIGVGGGVATTTYTPNVLNQYATINPGALQSVHDLDGNLTEDKGVNSVGEQLKYEWDGENRLRVVRRASDAALIASYEYDAFSRRIRKTTTAAAIQGVSDTGYIYDGWNLVAEYAIAATDVALSRAFTWGLDLSGTIRGAGGVGGLLCVHKTPSLDVAGNRVWGAGLFPTLDGNGNVSEYLDDSGAVAAHYEYGPFGEPLLSTGTVAAEMPFRFSTKYQDTETGLIYYGYRFYEPSTGRWLNRDPIEEEGGLNLYVYVGNNPNSFIDPLGLSGEPQALNALNQANQALASANADFDIALKNYNAATSAVDKGRCSIAFSMAQKNIEAAREALRQAQLNYQQAAAAAAAAGTGVMSVTGTSVGLSGAGASLPLVTIGGLAAGTAVVGGAVGYGIGKIPTGGGGNVHSAIGNGMYYLAPSFFHWLIQ